MFASNSAKHGSSSSSSSRIASHAYTCDSGQNSMEYWDYTIELECLKGPQDVEAATELGRTLLERNRDLEMTIRQQQVQLDDQAQQLHYLAKQNSVLRQAAESRLRLCEQLESSVAELERSKMRILRDLAAERQKTMRLKAENDAMEAKCAELQSTLEQSRAEQLQTQQLLRSLEQQQLVQQSQNASKDEFNALVTFNCTNDALVKMAEALAEAEERMYLSTREVLDEKRRRQQLERELRNVQEENEVLKQQLNATEGSDTFPVTDSPSGALSLGEELLLSSGDYTMEPWAYEEGWEALQPLSFIEHTVPSVSPTKADMKHFDDFTCSQSSSGFSEEPRPSPENPNCNFSCVFCQKLNSVTTSTSESLALTKEAVVDGRRTENQDGMEAEEKTSISEHFNQTTDFKQLFREIFAVIKQNI